MIVSTSWATSVTQCWRRSELPALIKSECPGGASLLFGKSQFALATARLGNLVGDNEDEGEARRRYDKGERRFKHVGTGPEPIIEFDDSEPKKWVGKCPNTLSDEDRRKLLHEAIAAPNGDRDLPVPKKLYVVHEGAVYEAQTSDHGRTYHGYPYKGKLSRTLLQALAEMAERKKCRDPFEKWVNEHVERHGA